MPIESCPQKIYLEVRDGVLVAAYCEDTTAELTLLDWDDAATEESVRTADLVCISTNAMPTETRQAFCVGK